MVFFDWDRSNLSQQAVQTVGQAAAAFQARGSARITATGHTDTSGPESYNMALSLRRANSVKNELVRDGVPADAVQVVGRGESNPLVPTADGVREPQNRPCGDRARRWHGRRHDDRGHERSAVLLPRAERPLSRNVGNGNADSQAGAALAECESGRTDKGIPMLERILTDAQVPLPPARLLGASDPREEGGPRMGPPFSFGQSFGGQSFGVQSLGQQGLEAVDQGTLAGIDLLARLGEGKPLRPIDLGKRLPAAAARRPFDLEDVARKLRHIEIALDGKGLDLLAAALADVSERRQRSGKRTAQLLRELPPRHGLGVFPGLLLAFGNGPGAAVPCCARTGRRDGPGGPAPHPVDA